MRTKKIELVEALDREYWMKQGFRYVWKQEISCSELLTVEESDSIEEGNLLEARIFTNGKELHIFPYEDVLQAVVTESEEGDDFWEESQLLSGRFGYSVIIRNYIAYDPDGQAYIIRSVMNGYDREGKKYGKQLYTL